MAEISAALVKKLREETGAGMLECKKALDETGGDEEKAKDLLRKKGIAAAGKRADRATGQGVIASYVHHSGKVGVLVECRCETDFVARTDEFKRLARTLAMQISVSNPRYTRRTEVPAEIVEKEREIAREQAAASGKPQNVVEKMVDGKIEKFLKESCLLDQDFLISPESDAKTVSDFVTEIAAKLGEKVEVGRFQRLEIG